MDWKPFLQNKWLVMLAVLGVVLILFGTLWNRANPSIPTLSSARQAGTSSAEAAANQPASALGTGSTADPVLAMEQAYDQQLTAIIDQLAGVQGAVVMVTLDSTNQLEVANDSRTTTQTQRTSSGTSSQTSQDNSVYTERQADGSSVPFVTAQQAPVVRGVLVLVDADDFAVARAEIIDAIGHVLDVPAYKISVQPKRSNP
ncbi:MAG: hypothetical protein K6T78_06130 [Alicyclobacillus sp.]|nr:hypothetical protein [Alicyclobacillus sp.]